jgi:hypothetical protein
MNQTDLPDNNKTPDGTISKNEDEAPLEEEMILAEGFQ